MAGQINLNIAGLLVIRSTERGNFIEHEVVANSSDIAGVVRAVLDALPDGGEISAPEASQNECYNECQRTEGTLQIKRGCHGSYGTWRPASTAEAIEWLLAGFKLSASNPRLEQVLIQVPSENV